MELGLEKEANSPIEGKYQQKKSSQVIPRIKQFAYLGSVVSVASGGELGVASLINSTESVFADLSKI